MDTLDPSEINVHCLKDLERVLQVLASLDKFILDIEKDGQSLSPISVQSFRFWSSDQVFSEVIG